MTSWPFADSMRRSLSGVIWSLSTSGDCQTQVQKIHSDYEYQLYMARLNTEAVKYERDEWALIVYVMLGLLVTTVLGCVVLSCVLAGSLISVATDNS